METIDKSSFNNHVLKESEVTEKLTPELDKFKVGYDRWISSFVTLKPNSTEINSWNEINNQLEHLGQNVTSLNASNLPETLSQIRTKLVELIDHVETRKRHEDERLEANKLLGNVSFSTVAAFL